MTASPYATRPPGTAARLLASRVHGLRPSAPAAALAVLAAAAPLALAAPPAAETPPATMALRVQQAEIVDRRGFERPIRAATMWVPAGWQTEGEVLWTQRLGCGRPFQPRLLAREPGGVGAIALLPGGGWGANSLTGAVVAGCPAASIDSAEAYLRAWVQQHRPGAQWLSYRPRPERQRRAPPQHFPGGGVMQQYHDAGQVLIGYRHEGREVHESLAVVVSVVRSSMPMPGSPPMQVVQGESLGMLAWRVPAGEFDARRFDAVWQTLRPDPAWQARVQAGMNQMAQDDLATGRAIGQIQAEGSRTTLDEIARRGQGAAKTRQEIAALQIAGDRDRAATGERMHRDTVQALREVQPYRDATGATVELPGHYAHAWRLRDGSFLLTDSPQLDPGRDLGLPGERLQRAR